MRDYWPVAAIVVLIIGAIVGLASVQDSCSKRHCPPGLSATLMMQHKNVYKCVCVGEPE